MPQAIHHPHQKIITGRCEAGAKASQLAGGLGDEGGVMMLEGLLHLASKMKGNGRLKIGMVGNNGLNKVKVKRIVPGGDGMPGNGRLQIDGEVADRKSVLRGPWHVVSGNEVGEVK